MGKRRIAVFGSIAVVLAVSVLAVGCTNPAPPGGRNYIFEATSLTDILQNEHSGPNFWDNDDYDEPFLAHLGIRLTLSPQIDVHLQAASTYDNNGAYICKIQQGQTCQTEPGDGIHFGGVYLPDLADLANNSQPFEIMGMIDFAMERDQLVPFGISQALDGIAQLADAALPTILANNGALPSDAQGILNFLQVVIPPALSTLFSIIAANIGAAIGGDSDDLIGFEPFLDFAVGGTLGELIKGILPTLLNLINQILINDPNSPLPNGIPAKLGVVGQSTAFTYGSADGPPNTLYKVTYRWQKT